MSMPDELCRHCGMEFRTLMVCQDCSQPVQQICVCCKQL